MAGATLTGAGWLVDEIDRQLVQYDAETQSLVSGDGTVITFPTPLDLTNNAAAPATRGTLIADWSSSYSGTANTLDTSPLVGGTALAQISTVGGTALAAANAGSQSSAMRQIGFWAMSTVRASGQCLLEWRSGSRK